MPISRQTGWGAFVFQGVLDFGRLLLDKSSRLEGWQVSLARTYDNHVIICGLGRVSYRVMLQLLESGYEVVIIESDWSSEFVSDALALNVPVIHDDARTARALRRAGIYRARGMITGISNDLLNIEVALSARRMRKDLHVVLRIFNEQLDYNLEKSQFGPNTAFSSSALAAPTLAAAAVCRGIKHALPIPGTQLGVSELVVTEGGNLDDLVYKIERRFNVQVIAYTGTDAQGERCWRHSVTANIRLYGGDRILLLGNLHALSNAWQHSRVRNKIMQTLGIALPERPTEEYNRVIVCGLGKVGYRVVKALCRMDVPPDVVVICDEAETRPRFLREVRNLGVHVINGDARTEEMLLEAGINRAYSLVAATADNLSNLRISLTARQMRGDIHLVLRVFSDVLADQLEGIFGIHTAFSTSALAAPTLSAAVVVPDTGYAVDIGNQLMSTARLTLLPGGEFDGKRVRDLREKRGIVVISIKDSQRTVLLPSFGVQEYELFERPLQAGDEIIVLAEIHTITALRNRGAETGTIDGAVIGRPTPRQAAITGKLPPHADAPADNLPAPQPRLLAEHQQMLEQLLMKRTNGEYGHSREQTRQEEPYR